jgi:hypothetical protein
MPFSPNRRYRRYRTIGKHHTNPDATAKYVLAIAAKHCERTGLYLHLLCPLLLLHKLELDRPHDGAFSTSWYCARKKPSLGETL